MSLTALQLICVGVVALFVLVRCVCVMNLMTRHTPVFIWLFYLADGVAAVGILWNAIHCVRPTEIEALLISVMGAAFAFDPRKQPREIVVGADRVDA